MSRKWSVNITVPSVCLYSTKYCTYLYVLRDRIKTTEAIGGSPNSVHTQLLDWFRMQQVDVTSSKCVNPISIYVTSMSWVRQLRGDAEEMRIIKMHFTAMLLLLWRCGNKKKKSFESRSHDNAKVQNKRVSIDQLRQSGTISETH